MSKFDNIPEPVPDAAFSLVAAYAKDPAKQKVDLCPGFYRDENAEPWILPCVVEAKDTLHNDQTLNHEHLPLTGLPDLVRGAQKLVFGAEGPMSPRLATIQTVSGTGANHLGSRFLSTFLKPKTVWISNPSWILHPDVWEAINSSVERRFYPYYDPKQQSLDFYGMMTTLEQDAEPNDVVILHACAHNPTGLDLSQYQWEEVARVCEQKKLFPFFDIAYQGFATGDLDADAWSIRHFFRRQKVDFAVAQSFSKNFGLYGERIGALHIALASPSQELSTRISAELARMQRSEITTAPSYGARIVSTILNTPALYDQWITDLQTMSRRMRRMRERLFEELGRQAAPGAWEHILNEIGMFTMSGLSREQVDMLIREYHTYLLPSGRISVTGLTESNVAYVAQSISAVLQTN